MEYTTQRAALTRDQLAMVRAEIRAQRDGLRGRADITTRIMAARGRYSHNPQPGKAVRVALGVIGMACVITHTWRRRIGAGAVSKISVNYCDGADHPELIRMCTTCTEPTCDGLCERYCDMYRQIMGKPERRTVISQADAVDDNRRHNARRIYRAFGETHTLTEWARITGLTYQTIWCRIERGMQIEEALSIGNYRSHCKFTFAGVTRGVTEWCRECKIPRSTFYSRLNGGMTIGQALGLEA